MEVPFFLVTLIGVFALFIGIGAGAITSNNRLRVALFVTCRSVARIRSKHGRRSAATVLRLANQGGCSAAESCSPASAGAPDQSALEAAHALRDEVEEEIGDRIQAMYLFGSRARGDHVATSDADIAIILDNEIELGLRSGWLLLRAAFQVMISRGLYLQVRTLRGTSAEASPLYSGILCDGRRIRRSSGLGQRRKSHAFVSLENN